MEVFIAQSNVSSSVACGESFILLSHLATFDGVELSAYLCRYQP